MCVYTYILHNIGNLSGKRNKKGFGTAVHAADKRNISACHFGHACHRFVSPFIECYYLYYVLLLHLFEELIREILYIFFYQCAVRILRFSRALLIDGTTQQFE